MKNSNKIYYIIIFLLIAVIIILCLSKCKNKKELSPVPTGNEDNFNININCKENKCDTNNKDKDEKSESSNKKNNNKSNNKEIIDTKDNIDNKEKSNDNDDTPTIPVNVDTYDNLDENALNEVYVDDANGNYIYQQKINIFSNNAFQYEDKIAPGVSNTYKFKANNTSNTNVKYYLQMFENSEYPINLKYRLRRNGKYIIGNDSTWVKAGELVTEYKILNGNTYDAYELDWKWFDDDYNDTIAGENMTSEYTLEIRFYFELTNENSI